MVLNSSNHPSPAVLPGVWQSSDCDDKLYQSQRSEVRLLLCCARTFINAATAENIETLCHEDLDWPWLLSLADRHDVTCLLYQSLQGIYSEAVPIPTSTIDRLRQEFQTHTFNNLFFTQELLKLIQLFEQHHIPVLPYKGPTLALTLYGDLSLRLFCDLDLSIYARDLIRVKPLLAAAGYDSITVDNDREEINLRSDNSRDFVRQDGKVVLDVHWRIAPRYFPLELTVEELFDRSQPLSLLGTKVSTLAPEDLLLVLCVHGAKECWRKLKWICDVAELIRTYPSVDWDRVVLRAKQLHSHRILLLGVGLAQQLLGARLPLTVMLAIQTDRLLPALMKQVCSYLFGAQPEGTLQIPSILFRLCLRDRAIDWLHFRWLLVPNVRDRHLVDLPQSLAFLYYLLRPLRLLGKKWGFIRQQMPGSERSDRQQSAVTILPDVNLTTTAIAAARPRCKSLDLYDLGDELLIYSDEQELGITLNYSSKQIWQLCDGTRNLEDMAIVLSEQLGCAKEVLLEDICTTIIQFHKLGLLASL